MTSYHALSLLMTPYDSSSVRLEKKPIFIWQLKNQFPGPNFFYHILSHLVTPYHTLSHFIS